MDGWAWSSYYNTMAKEGNFQSNLKCPKCNKRKVYVEVEGELYKYVCASCGEEWYA
jgi:transcription elongation factor Elf1